MRKQLGHFFDSSDGRADGNLQSWPLSPAVGSTMGFLAGNFIAWAQSAYHTLAMDVAAIQAEEKTASKASAKKVKKKVQSLNDMILRAIERHANYVW